MSLRKVAEVLATKFDLVADSLLHRRVGPVKFMVFMEDEVSAPTSQAATTPRRIMDPSGCIADAGPVLLTLPAQFYPS